MGKPKRSNVLAVAEESMTPPDELTATQSLARVVKAEGNSLYTCALPDTKPILVEQPRFRNTMWIRRGGYVLVDLARVVGEIVNVVRDEKQPKEFAKNTYDDSEDEDSTVGKMPPSDSEEEGP
ncbi:hypothetical protein V8F06_012809 [Rhypophila decipiens]